jgi:NTE family protein
MNGEMTLRDWLEAEPFTLVMSSGFFSFFSHCGVLAALADESLVPEAVSGSSAGALTAGLWAAGLEPAEIRELYVSLRKQDFWDPAPGPGLLKGRRFRALIRHASPVQRLEHCRRPLTVSAFDLLRMRTRVLSSGDLARALYASCAVPLMFHPLWHQGGWLIDGGLGDRPGLSGVPTGRRVFYHHITYQSTWRRRHSPNLGLPGRPNLVALTIPDLPRPRPDALHIGPAAWAAARTATLRALDRLVRPGRDAHGPGPSEEVVYGTS